VADVIKFPRRHRQEQLDFREMCRTLVAESSLAGSHTATEIARAVETVVALANQYWFRDDEVRIKFSEEVQFTPGQLAEINRAVADALGQFRLMIFGRAAAERLVLELRPPR